MTTLDELSTKIDEEEILVISEITNVLQPVKAAVEALCRRDANLLTADAILSFAMDKLKQQKTALSEKLFEALAVRIGERRTDLAGVLKYLHTGSSSTINDNESEDNRNIWPEFQDLFAIPSRYKIEKVIFDLVMCLEPQENEKENDIQDLIEVDMMKD